MTPWTGKMNRVRDSKGAHACVVRRTGALHSPTPSRRLAYEGHAQNILHIFYCRIIQYLYVELFVFIVYLNCHSCFSLRYGVMSARELLEEAARKGIHSLALTDINFSGECQEFIRLAPGFGIRPLIGIDFRDGVRQLYVGLARNMEGFRLLNIHLSRYLHSKVPPLEPPPPSDHYFIIYPITNYDNQALPPGHFIGIHAREIPGLSVRKRAIDHRKIVILHTVSFRNKRDFNTHRLLRAIDKNTLLSKLQKSEEGLADHYMLHHRDFDTLYAPYPDLVRQTTQLMEQCHIDTNDSSRHKNLRHFTGSARGDSQLIRQLCQNGLNYRYKNVTEKIRKRIQKELNTITRQGYISYFLINWHIVNYALKKGYFYVGRGSGANSIIAYLLRITDVDPIELDLYFERFINIYRSTPPDFDIDFSWRDRKDITRFIFDTFDHVALLGTHNTFQKRAMYRELGKVFGLPDREIRLLQDASIPTKRLDRILQTVKRYAVLIHDKPSHISVHASGIVIAQQDIHNYTATELPPKGFPTTQFDMITAENIRLYKFDILSQRGLGKIKDCLDIIRSNRPEESPIDIHRMEHFFHDEKVKHLLRRGEAIGCFYVESPAMRMLLAKLQADNYLGLVAASSVIRPGVSSSGMMGEYIRRYRNPELRKQAHPVLLDIMPETFGVMVYQEDVIKVAHYFAGLSAAEADVLRRGMSGKYRSREEFQQVRKKFFSNCHKRGHKPKLTQEIWKQIESFAGYAFAKGHSASYAVESYQCLYLKAHYPIEYMVAVINNGGGFYRQEFYLHEARVHGAQIELPCINTSTLMTILRGKTIYLGLGFIKDIQTGTVRDILQTREREGLFKDLYDCIQRTHTSLEQALTLIRIGAFRFTGESKKHLMWQAHFLLGNHNTIIRQPGLFQTRPKRWQLPKFDQRIIEDAFDEIELLGFTMSDPFALVKATIPDHDMADTLRFKKGKDVCTYGYLVTVKKTRTKQNKTMYFGTFLDRKGHFLDTVHFPPVAAQYPFRGRGVYLLKGIVTEEFDFYTIEISYMHKEPYIDDPRYNERPTIKTLQNDRTSKSFY